MVDVAAEREEEAKIEEEENCSEHMVDSIVGDDTRGCISRSGLFLTRIVRIGVISALRHVAKSSFVRRCRLRRTTRYSFVRSCLFYVTTMQALHYATLWGYPKL